MNREPVRRHFESEEEKQAYIAERIADSRKRKENRKFEYCPACKGGVATRAKFMLHLQKCCKDLLKHHKLTDMNDLDKFSLFLASISEKEAELKAQALYLRYMDPNRTKRRTVEEVAQFMGLPIERTERMIKMASKEIPLAKDLDPVEILFEDEWLVAVQKPPFIITAPKHRFLGGTLFSRVYGYLGKAPFGLHRLDMNTSGCVVFAKDAASAETVNAQFRNKTVQKAYLAICLGTPKDHEFVVETHMDGDPSHETAQKVTENEGKWSKTSFKVLDSNSKIDLTKDSIVQGSKFDSTSLTNGACLLLCRPLTGRTHQIRLHCSHKEHCIIGDDIYGIQGPWIERQALHAFHIKFVHPSKGEEISIFAPPPEDFQNALEKLGLELPNSVFDVVSM